MRKKLEQLLNTMDGDVVAVVPNVRPYFLFYGGQVDYVMVVEKLKSSYDVNGNASGR